MKKRKLLSVLTLLLIVVFALGITACKKDPITLDALQNEHGVVVDGGGFVEGSTLVSNVIEPTTEEAAQVIAALAEQDYDKEGSVYIFDIYVAKDGAKVQPNGKVKVTLPLPDAQTDGYIVFHVKDDGSVEKLVPIVEGNTISFETSSFSYFVIAQEKQEEPEHVHQYTWVDGTPSSCVTHGTMAHYHCDGCGKDFNENYGEITDLQLPLGAHQYTWVGGTPSSCVTHGTMAHYHCDVCGKDFNENYGEITDLQLPLGAHEYGEMYYANPPTFFNDGNIAYYHCGVCKNYFNEQLEKVQSVVIPKLSSDLSICVNGQPTALVVVERHENLIVWGLESLSVTKGDVITICQTGDVTKTFNYFAEGNLSREGIILTTAESAEVNLTATPNGLMLYIGGYKYEGVVIEINGVQHPMSFVTYLGGEETSYVYGYVEFAVGDRFVIVDNVSGAVYDYDDVSEEFNWNTWDYHRGDNGQIVIDFAARYGVEFDKGGSKEIYITKAFAPNDGQSFGVVFEGEREDEIFDSMELPTEGVENNEFMWTLTHGTTMNNADIVEYIDKNGLWFYYKMIDIEAGEKFSLKNFTTGGVIGADNLVDILGDITAVTRDGDLVSVQKSGTFYIIYLPAFNSFTIECDTSDPLAEITLYAGDTAITLIPDENGDIFYEGFESKTYHVIAIDDARYSPLPIILDDAMDKTLVNLTVDGEYYAAYPTKEGKFNLRYNVHTGVLFLEYISGGGDVGGGEDQPTIDDYYIFLSVVDYTNGNQTIRMSKNPENANQVYARVETMAANSFISVGVMLMGGDYSTTTYGALSDTPADVATSLGEIIQVYVAGPIDVYFDFSAKTIKVVKTGDLPEQTTLPKDIYISTMEKYAFTENPNNADELCYLGLALESYDDFRIRDTDNNYISDITLAAGTTGAQTSGSAIMVEKEGTYDIYINKTTHVVRIVLAESGGGDVGGDKDYSDGVYLLLDDLILLYPDEGGNVSYNDFAVDDETAIGIFDKSYNSLPLTLDAEVSSSVALVRDNILFFYKNGRANMTYNVKTGVIFVEMSSVSLAGSKVYLFYSSTNINASADENGVVTFENIVFTDRETIRLTDSAIEYLAMTLDPAMDTAIGSVVDYGGMPTLIINSAGTYNIRYDLKTGVILVEKVEESDPTPDPEPDPEPEPEPEPTPDGTVIQLIEIFGVKTPLAGKHPTADGVYVLQEGVEVVSVDWGYEAWDSTGEYVTTWLTESDVFDEAMYSSIVKIRLRTLDGYYFNYIPDDGYHDIWVTLNGGSDTFQQDITDDPYHVVDIYAHLVINAQAIKVVEVYDLDRPVPGEAPDYEVIAAGEGYAISGIYWYENIYDEEGSYVESILMDKDDVFTEGRYYSVQIVFVVDEGRDFAAYDGYLAVRLRINGEGIDASFVDELDPTKEICGTMGYDCYAE